LTGLRWGDVNRLKWSDIQHSKEMGNFIYKKNSKTNSNDYHPINEQAVQILGDRGDNESFIFEGLKYNDSTNNQLKLWILKAGINKKITFHNFRHSYATLLLSNGVDIATVSKMLNHKNIRTTMVYAKVMVKAKKEAANSIKMEL
jgi:integrase